MNNFYSSIVFDSKSTIISRLVFTLIIVTAFFIPYFIGMTDTIIDDDKQENILAIIFISAVLWIVVAMMVFIVFFVLFFLAKAAVWVFTGDVFIEFDGDAITQIFAYIFSPFIFVFNLILCKNDDKTFFIKNLFKKRNDKAKELLTDDSGFGR